MLLDHAKATIRLLGDVGVWVDNEDARPRGRKARVILAVIGNSRDHRASREFLADLLWSDRGETQARSSLRQALAEIRGTAIGAPDLLSIGRDQVSYTPGVVATDIDAILAACAHRDIGRLAAALSTAGIFLAGFDGLAPAFDEWLRAERPRAHDLIVSSVLAQSQIMLSTGGGGANVQTIIRALETLDPNNEVVARLAMEADFGAGDGASLHRRYRRLCRELQDEFGARPAPETQALFARLTSGEPPSAARMIDTLLPSVEPPPRSEKTPPMVMVSPLSVGNGDIEIVQIAAAATDDIRAALSRHSEIRVISLETLDTERVAAVCAGAFATYMLSGTVRRTEDGARVNLQLGNVDSSVIVWSDQLRLDRGTIDGVVDRIVARAVGAVMPAIDRDFAIRTRTDHPDDVEPASLYARGRYLIRTVRHREAVETGMELLRQAIRVDPGHVGARLLLAQIYNTDLWQQVAGHDHAAYRAHAMTLTQEAAALEPENARIQVKLSWCYLRRGDWDAADRRLRLAVSSSPYDADSINECAMAFTHLGELQIAEDLMQRSFLLNPFAPADYHADYAILLAMKGEPILSEEHFEASGENRLQYVAARMANLQRVPRSEALRGNLRREFLVRFADAWQPQVPYDESDIAAWFAQTYPFRRPDHRRFWNEGFTAALR